jgi:hypothetical protein
MGESGHLGQVVLVPKTGLRGDCDFVKRVSKAGRGNDRAWKAGKAKKTAFHPSPTPWKSLRDYQIPTASTAVIFQCAGACETESKAYRPQGGL